MKFEETHKNASVLYDLYWKRRGRLLFCNRHSHVFVCERKLLQYICCCLGLAWGGTSDSAEAQTIVYSSSPRCSVGIASDWRSEGPGFQTLCASLKRTASLHRNNPRRGIILETLSLLCRQELANTLQESFWTYFGASEPPGQPRAGKRPPEGLL